MYSLFLAMILALRPAIVYVFITCLCFYNIFSVNICIPFVWQWISLRAQRAFLHLLLFLWFGLCFIINIKFFCCNDFCDAPNKRLFIYCFSYCSVNIFLINIWIVCVWQWFPRRTKRAFMNAFVFLWFHRKHMNSLCFIMIMETRPAIVYVFMSVPRVSLTCS